MPLTPDMFAHSSIRSQAPIYCVYHKVDFDGECSAAIVARNTVDCEFVPYNYSDPFPWHVFEGANRRPICYMVDVSLPITAMCKLSGLADLCWIDHHKSKIEEAQAANFNPPGVRDPKYAACELTWGHFHGNYADLPLAVRLLGRYDAWDHSDPRTLPFQYCMRQHGRLKPASEKWSRILAMTADEIDEAVAVGNELLLYQNAQYQAAITQFGFPTHMFGYSALACNSLPGGSQLFVEHPDSANYQLFVLFYWRDKVGWTISLYTNDKSIDCGAIARRMGGGGHQSAAGYVVSVLPEELQTHHDDSHIKGI